jgi:hypothetical protein
MIDKSGLPNPPEFPASNASYNKIVAAMHKAALEASTCAAAIAAVQVLSDAVKGTNTYARASRRYAGNLIAAFATIDPAAQREALSLEAPAAVLTATEKRRLKESHGSDDPMFIAEAEEAMADSLIEVEAPQIVATPTADGGLICQPVPERKTFFDKSNAKRGLKRAQLDHLPIALWVNEGDDCEADNLKVRPVLLVTDAKGIAYAAERGFEARVK